MNMPSIDRFKRFDVRPLLEKGAEPLPEILKRVQAFHAGDGLIIVAPFLPSPLIELLGSQGFASKDRARRWRQLDGLLLAQELDPLQVEAEYDALVRGADAWTYATARPRSAAV